MPSPVAAIDIGTNSVLLLVAEERQGELVPLHERAQVTRLGQGVDHRRELSSEAVARTLECLRDYRQVVDQFHVHRLAVAGTSALRDARGSESFLEAAQKILGVEVEIITGEREARLAFEGGLSSIGETGPVVVVDIGGGSTEIISGEVFGSGPILRGALSLDIGSVRLTERYLHADPPTPDELVAQSQAIALELSRLGESPELKLGSGGHHSSLGHLPPPRVIGVAGTVTTLAQLTMELPAFDAAALHGARLTQKSIEAIVHKLSALTVNERKQLPGMTEGRADVILAGACILEQVLRLLGVDEVMVSVRGLRWGLARELMQRA